MRSPQARRPSSSRTSPPLDKAMRRRMVASSLRGARLYWWAADPTREHRAPGKSSTTCLRSSRIAEPIREANIGCPRTGPGPSDALVVPGGRNRLSAPLGRDVSTPRTRLQSSQGSFCRCVPTLGPNARTVDRLQECCVMRRMAIDRRIVPITRPCPVDLDTLSERAGAKRRFCGHCSGSIYLREVVSDFRRGLGAAGGVAAAVGLSTASSSSAAETRLSSTNEWSRS